MFKFVIFNDSNFNIMYFRTGLIVALFFASINPVQGQGFLKARDTQIIDGKGNEVILHGMGLGGWMLQEGYMLQINHEGTQHSIKARIADLIGKENCDKFYDLWLQNHMTKSDVDSLAKWGFNSVRLPMHYNLFTLPIQEEPVQDEQTWLNKGFEMVDSLIAWCKVNNMFLILDLHAAPGGQGKDANISDYDETMPSLWESESNKQKTVALWRKLAEKYANEPTIGGFDLINEPNWTFEGKNKNGLEDTLNQPIWDLYIQITQAIREVDKNHLIIIEGNGWGNNYRGFIRPWDNNMALSFHKYWSPNTYQTIRWIVGLREKYNMPVWLGESGENADKWFTDCISLVEKQDIGWCWWPLKKINSVVCPLMVVAPKEYKQITEYWNGDGPKPSRELSEEVLFKIAENLKSEYCRFNKDVIDAMFRQRAQSSPIPYTLNTLPGRIYATDFDMGPSGIAYSDTENENTGEEGKKAGNTGHQYRNDGVDIESCLDDQQLSNGYCVTSVKNGEWLQFTVFFKQKGTYDLYARIANKNEEGRLKLLFYRNLPVTNEENPEISSESATIPVTGDNQLWKTVPVGTVRLEKGTYIIRSVVEKGGFNFNYIDFQKYPSDENESVIIKDSAGAGNNHDLQCFGK
jgi:aryl-phospho-beta-D-glucosidase BglC (GH1 family)